MSCASQAPLKTVYLLGLLLNPSIFSRLRYPILFQLALLLISPIQPCPLWLATSFWEGGRGEGVQGSISILQVDREEEVGGEGRDE